MQQYCIHWMALSAYSTELQSDTIFGHLAWAIRYCHGEERLERIIRELPESPLVLSSAFPLGQLPLPQISPSRKLLAEVKAGLKVDNLLWEVSRKKMKAARWMDKESFLRAGCRYNHFEQLKAQWENLDKKQQFKAEKEIIIHNSINRISGTTGESGNLYSEETTFSAPDTCFESYLDTDVLSGDELNDCFRYIEYTGFGKRKSSGKGYFKIEVHNAKWDYLAKPNAYLSLSNHIPASDDSVDVLFSGFTKFAKLGGNSALTDSPYKYPFYLFKPGTVYLSNVKPKGTILRGIHPDRENIVQNLLNYSIPMFYEEGV